MSEINCLCCCEIQLDVKGLTSCILWSETFLLSLITFSYFVWHLFSGCVYDFDGCLFSTNVSVYINVSLSCDEKEPAV